jgi:hypothetical protein
VTGLDDLFAREGDMASQGAVLAPLVRLYVAEGRFPRNTRITLPGGNLDRDPDGWFHPSTHPTMDARKLYYYLAQPQRWVAEPWGYEGRMSVTVGTLEHAIVQMALADIGALIPPTGTCPCCGRPYGPGDDECGEPGVADPVLRRRGHMDGIVMTPALGMTGFDLKTINHFSAAKIPEGPDKAETLAWLRAKHPYYYGQMQEYMALSGLRMMIMLFIGMGFPWVMREIHVEYNPTYVVALEAKYRLVRAAEAAGMPPEQCCAIGSKESKSCPATGCAIRSF